MCLLSLLAIHDIHHIHHIHHYPSSMLLTKKWATSSRNAADDCDADALLVGRPLQHGLGHLASALLEICDGSSTWEDRWYAEEWRQSGVWQPFLSLDKNPYMVISHLRCLWPAHPSR